MKRKCKKNVLRIDKPQQKTSVPSQNTDERSMNEKKTGIGSKWSIFKKTDILKIVGPL